jgi:Plant ATP synthase F0
MPQFDQFSFFNQVFFFFVFFYSFYFCITYYFLPKICYNIKFRKKKIVFDNNKKNQINFEKNNIIFFFNNSYQYFYQTFELFLIQKKINYKKNQILKIKEMALINTTLNSQINLFLNQKFLLFKKIFI